MKLYSVFTLFIFFSLSTVFAEEHLKDEINNSKFFTIKVGDTTKDLEIRPVTKNIGVAYVNFLDDWKFADDVAKSMSALIPIDTEILIAPEANAIPVLHALARIKNIPCVTVRKTKKSHMENPLIEPVTSITTATPQTLVLTAESVKKINGKKVTIIDDVSSTGATLKALVNLVNKAGGILNGIVVAFKEGEGVDLGIQYLAKLPIFDLRNNSQDNSIHHSKKSSFLQEVDEDEDSSIAL